jgi:DNA-binding NarL/FixJ family response regulator
MSIATLAPPSFVPAAQRSRVADLSRREQEVLSVMALGRSNRGIARDLLVSEGAVEKHVASIFSKLGLTPSPADHRRVLAVVAYLSDR